MLGRSGAADLGCSEHVRLILDSTIVVTSILLVFHPPNAQRKDGAAGFYGASNVVLTTILRPNLVTHV
eukprot:SAG22_NODE_3123_length_1920_cov_1.129050_2_plen_68_part_00